MTDSGWVAVVGVAVGGSLAGTAALLQARWQHRSEAVKANKEEATQHRAALMQIYTRYQLAADRLENAIWEWAESRRSESSSLGATATIILQPGVDYLAAFEAAQREYDAVCEVVRLVAPSKTVEVALQQRQLFNRFTLEARDRSYNRDASSGLIDQAARPVLAAMRADLGSPE